MALVRFSQGGWSKVSVLLPLVAFVLALSFPVPAFACAWAHWQIVPGASPVIIYVLLATAANLLALLLLFEFRGGEAARILKRCWFFILFSCAFVIEMSVAPLLAGSNHPFPREVSVPLINFVFVSLSNIVAGIRSERREVRIVGVLSLVLVAGYILFALISAGTVFLATYVWGG